MTINSGDKTYENFSEFWDSIQEELEARPWYVKLWDGVYTPFRRVVENGRQLSGRVRNTYERARYGYGHRDLWDFPEYITKLIGSAAGDLADIADSWPQSKEFPTFESWIDFLKQLEYDLAWYSIDSVDFFGGYKSKDFVTHNSYDEQRLKTAREALERFAKNFDGMWD